ncbi:MAG: 30S ribosomal protein S5 [Candidatus Saccharibacteria bacterium]|nr:30S ribosomal protein S5 [Candidatus Saccharibacteria bacterium]
MPEAGTKAPKVINKSGTLKMMDEVAMKKEIRDIAGKKIERRGRRDRVKADVSPKEFDELTIAVDRVSRTVAGGRRMRFKALVAIGNHKNKVGIGVAKGNDVTTAVAKATAKAKKAMITFNMDGETICHETRTKVTGADVLLKPAAPGTGIIAGGTVRAIMGLTGVKNLISKSLGSTNKVNIAYAVIEGLGQQVSRKDWLGHSKGAEKVASKDDAKKVKTESETVKAEKVKKADTKKVAKDEKVAEEKAEAAKKEEKAKTIAKPKSAKKAALKEEA